MGQVEQILAGATETHTSEPIGAIMAEDLSTIDAMDTDRIGTVQVFAIAIIVIRPIVTQDAIIEDFIVREIISALWPSVIFTGELGFVFPTMLTMAFIGTVVIPIMLTMDTSTGIPTGILVPMT